MVEYREQGLDRTFAALSDPTRRAILTRLGSRILSVSELAEPFPISLQAVIKHLDVLADAGLITRKKTGRTVACSLANERIAHATKWLQDQHSVWSGRLDRFDAYLQTVKGDPDEPVA